MEIDFSVQIWREGHQYIAHATPLDVASSGPTADAARVALDEAVDVFLKTAADQGTLEEVLEEAGYERREGSWNSPDWVAVERHTALVAA